MSVLRLFNADVALSVLLHVLKALVALLLNWIVLRHFAVDDFVTWSVTSSILVVASASDLGIGQYAVTRLIDADRAEWPAHVGHSLGALIPLALVSGLFVLIAVDGPSLLYSLTMAMLLAGRMLTIPFVAVLHAENQFKIRKALELGAYLVAVVLVGAISLTSVDIHLALVALNATFLLGFVLMMLASARYISVRASLRAVSLGQSGKIFQAAVPFMVNNVTGLLTYGGFLWLSSLILPQDQVAKLAILHLFVLVNLYQVYDVFLKARQADLGDPARLPPYGKLNVMLMLALPPAFLLAGREALAVLSGSQIAFGAWETVLYGVFVALELGNLFAQSVTQVNLARVNRLKWYSAIRAAMMGAFVLVGLLPADGETKLLSLLTLLALGSLISFVYLQRGGSGSAFPRREPASAEDATPHSTAKDGL